MKKYRLYNDGGEETTEAGENMPAEDNLPEQTRIPHLDDENEEML